jgi:hypothetical protein
MLKLGQTEPGRLQNEKAREGYQMISRLHKGYTTSSVEACFEGFGTPWAISLPVRNAKQADTQASTPTTRGGTS